ncbi:GTPase HflX [Patescibacteria group bacterium]|nr:GTPase HflX [Patescibacteria group bacterium]MBU1035019.1 GTPase HflX [Patescibacteria group bacterium]MBU1907681.1 GTPase HflX [Patescibacteria group bacterium]
MTPRAILVDVIPPKLDKHTAERRLFELESLTATFGGITVVKIIQKRSVPDYRTYVGSGKVEEIIQAAKTEKANLVIINNLLKPKQMFCLGELLRPHEISVWDRIDLILKIFQKHATTAEAKLQIKLAAVRHMGPRIFGMGMEMMQQAGGIGTRGIGETNTEIMKRHLSDQERQLKKQLERVARSRAEHRRSRDRRGLKTVSIIGYTNAGKSSLLRALTKKGAYVADELFATLDTRIGSLWFPNPDGDGGTKVLLSDTIGFIQDLPLDLISAFRSTLDETVDAELLLHIIDAGDEHIEEKIREVDAILEQLGVGATPRLHVLNKIDLISPERCAELKRAFEDRDPILVSAQEGKGLDALKQRIAYALSG